MIFNGTSRFPLFQTVMGRKYYYHIIDDSRNGIRIPVPNPFDKEKEDGDIVNIPDLGDNGNGNYTIRLNRVQQNIYNSYVF